MAVFVAAHRSRTSRELQQQTDDQVNDVPTEGRAAQLAHRAHFGHDGTESRTTSFSQRSALEDMDTDGDGVLSGPEIKRAFKELTVRADILLVRLEAEREIATMVRKLPVFIFCMATFLLALIEFTPPESTYDVHRHLRSHFGLGDIGDIGDYSDMYAYMESFAEKNAELQPSSTKYWCEDRYSHYHWDASYSVPHWTCTSPRQYALSLTSDADESWSSVNGLESSSGHHRRLGSTAGAASSGSSTCEDDNYHLAMEANDPNATCATYLRACDMEIGQRYCPYTCGYCGPFTYNHRKDFPYGQLTMLPVVVFQTRFATGDCGGFATVYQKQPHNGALWKLPALDGARNGKLLKCLDRNKMLDDDYAMEKPCPDNAPVDSCPPGGTLKVTPKATFHGETIYPKLLMEPHHDIVQLEHLQWLDRFTDSLTVSTMIYTEGVEIFTSLSVTFKISASGNVDAKFSMISYRDLVGDSRTTFVVCLLCVAVGALFGVILSVWHLCWDWEHCRMGLVMYEMVSRALLCAFPTFLLVTWTQQKPMSVEYDELLHTFLDAGSDADGLVKNFFEVKTHIYAETQWLKAQRVTAYIVLYFQFLQTIFYMSAHPKMGVLTDTICKAGTHLVHFILLFSALFLTLGWMAHWMFGEHIGGFGTFSDTIRSQVEMMYGDVLLLDGFDELATGYAVMYWIYTVTFLVVVFFTLLNFFLAIIVDAFCDVKDAQGNQDIISGFFTDVYRVAIHIFRWQHNKWPRRLKFIGYFKRKVAELSQRSWLDLLEHENGKAGGDDINLCVTPEEILEGIEGLTPDMLGDILAYYYSLSTTVIARRSKDDGKKKKKDSNGWKDRCSSSSSSGAATTAPASIYAQESAATLKSTEEPPYLQQSYALQQSMPQEVHYKQPEGSANRSSSSPPIPTRMEDQVHASPGQYTPRGLNRDDTSVGNSLVAGDRSQSNKMPPSSRWARAVER